MKNFLVLHNCQHFSYFRYRMMEERSDECANFHRSWGLRSEGQLFTKFDNSMYVSMIANYETENNPKEVLK